MGSTVVPTVEAAVKVLVVAGALGRAVFGVPAETRSRGASGKAGRNWLFLPCAITAPGGTPEPTGGTPVLPSRIRRVSWQTRVTLARDSSN